MKDTVCFQYDRRVKEAHYVYVTRPLMYSDTAESLHTFEAQLPISLFLRAERKGLITLASYWSNNSIHPAAGMTTIKLMNSLCLLQLLSLKPSNMAQDRPTVTLPLSPCDGHQTHPSMDIIVK